MAKNQRLAARQTGEALLECKPGEPIIAAVHGYCVEYTLASGPLAAINWGRHSNGDRPTSPLSTA